jgi:protease-4
MWPSFFACSEMPNREWIRLFSYFNVIFCGKERKLRKVQRRLGRFSREVDVKQFFKMFAASLLAMGVLVFFGFMMLMALAAIGQKKTVVEANSLLVLDLSVPISDKPMSEDFNAVVEKAMGDGGEKAIPLIQVLRAIDWASSDERIAGILIKGNVNGANGNSGFATLNDVRQKLLAFKDSGKPIYAYNLGYGEGSYYLASVADHLYTHPFGSLELNGFAASMLYFKGAFEKYGIDVQVTRVGKYKSAVEPFMLNEMSEANREQIGMFLGDLFDVLLSSIAESRGKTVEELVAFANERGLASGPEAVEFGFCDKALYYDELVAELKTVTQAKEKDEDFKAIGMEAYYRVAKKEKGINKSKNKIAVIYAQGEIVDGKNEKEVGGATVAALLRKAREDEDVKAVVLRVNSPGGSALASEEIQRETRLIKGNKPFVVSMGSVAASGGYWISAYADEIFAQPNTITGSIGVFGMFPSIGRLMEDHGISPQVVRTAEMADLGSMYRTKTDKELAVIQGFIDQIYEEFLDKVAEGRAMDRSAVAEIAQGRVWSGKTAKDIGLVDSFGGLEGAIASAAQRAELGDDYKTIQYQKEKELVEALLEEMGMAPNAQHSSMSKMSALVKEGLEMMNLWNDPRGVYARLPYQLELQ